MKAVIKSPRILKINSVKGLTISCVFNNGEVRDIDFASLLRKWKVTKKDKEYELLNPLELRKAKVRNQTLSWKNITVTLLDAKGNDDSHFYEIDPVTLYQNSTPHQNAFKKFNLGRLIKTARAAKGISQDELAARSGTSKTYISRIENNKIDPALHTLYKIVEIGLGKKIELRIV